MERRQEIIQEESTYTGELQKEGRNAKKCHYQLHKPQIVTKPMRTSRYGLFADKEVIKVRLVKHFSERGFILGRNQAGVRKNLFGNSKRKERVCGPYKDFINSLNQKRGAT